MYYTSYQHNKKRKSNVIFIIILLIFILSVFYFFLFNKKIFSINKGLSHSYIDKLIEHKEYDKALKLLLNHIAKGVNINWWYFYKAGIIYYYQSDYLTSLLYFRSAAFYSEYERIPSDINFYMGDNYYKLGKPYYPYAIKFFEKYLKIVNTSRSLISEADFLYKLSIMYVEVQKYDIAYKTMQKILNTFENDYRFLYYYSLTLKNLQKIDEALQYLKTIEKNTNDLDIKKETLFLLGKIYCEIEQYKKAIEYFLLCVDIYPNSDNSYYFLGYCYSQLHDLKTATNYLTKALLINSNNELARKLLNALK